MTDEPSGSDEDGAGRLYEFLQSRKGESVGKGWGEATPWLQLTGPIREECIAVYRFVRAESEARLDALEERVCEAGGGSALLEDAFRWFKLRDEAARRYREERDDLKEKLAASEG